MKQKEERKIKNKRLSIPLLQCVIVIGCIIIFCVLITPKDIVKDTTYSYSKLEEVKEYKIEGNHITRVRPLTEYKTFKETAEYTLNNNEEEITYTVKVYADSNKTQEVTKGYIKSGMVLERIPNWDNTANKTTTYTISVIGDFTKDGDINITELTKIIKGVVGLNNWRFTEEEKLIADFNGDKEVNVVDIEECINYIVYGRLTLENGTKLKATDEYGITWNYTYQNGEATDVYYESGELSEILNIPATLDGYPVVKLYNSSEERSIFAKAEDDYEELEREIDSRRLFRKPDHKSSLNIKNINIPNTVKTIGNNAFEICTNVENINIPNDLITIGDYAFYGCTSLTNINMPDTIENIGKYAFAICGNMTNISLPRNIKRLDEGAFWSCISLTNIDIPANVTTIEDYAFGECKTLISVNIGDGVTTIGERAFNNCDTLNNIEISDSVINIGLDAFDNTAWYRNQPEGVVYAGKVVYAYNGWEKIPENTVIELEEGTKGIAEEAFWMCFNLVEIRIPESIIRVGYNAFKNTSWYNNQPDGVVYAGKVAYKYKGIMPENTVIELKEGTKSITDYAFESCAGLINIKIPDTVTNIGNHAFYSCESLTSVDIPEGVTHIADSTFRYCTNLTDVKIPEGVTKIESNAFSACSSLTSINIPTTVTSIEEFAFENCTKLKDIVIWKNVDEVGNRTFGGWSENQTLNIEAEQIPEGWHEDWNYGSNAKIVYGYTGN